jgi:hypothetical protein
LARTNLNRPTDVPRGFPNTVREAWVWKGSDFEEDDYVVYLQENDIIEIENALIFFKGMPSPVKMTSYYEFCAPLTCLQIASAGSTSKMLPVKHFRYLDLRPSLKISLRLCIVALGSRCFVDLHRESIRVLTMPSSI